MTDAPTVAELLEEPPCPAGFPAAERAAMFGLSAMQLRWALWRHAGCNKTECARRSGYRGTDADLRSKGSGISRSLKVIKFLELLEIEAAGPAAPALDAKGMRAILEKIARGRDTQQTIRAIEALNRLDAAARQAEMLRFQTGTPEQTLDEIATLGPDFVCIAHGLARKHGIDWTPGGARGRPGAEMTAQAAVEDADGGLWPGSEADDARE